MVNKKIFIAPIAEEPKLLNLYEKSDRQHTIVTDPTDADIILLGRVTTDLDEVTLSLIQKYPNKCFSLDYNDHAIYLVHGIYTSANHRSLLGWRRIRTGSYMLLSDKFLNPFIQNFSPGIQIDINKKYLFSFIGRNCHPVRDALFRMSFSQPKIKIENSHQFDIWRDDGRSLDRQRYFFDVLSQSKFSLCPRGAVSNSIRLFESLQMGVAPIIISDVFLFPKGPDWKSFSIILKEKDISLLEEIVLSHEDRYVEMGILARQCYEEYFSEQAYFNYIVCNCLDIQRTQLIPEALYWKSRFLYLRYAKVKNRLLKKFQ